MSKSFWIVVLPVLVVAASLAPKVMEFLTITSTMMGLFAAIKYLAERSPGKSDDRGDSAPNANRHGS